MADFIRIPPDSTGKRLIAKKHVLENIDHFVQASNITDHENPNQGLKVDPRGAAAVRFAEGQPIMDSHSNLKVVRRKMVGVYDFAIDGYEELFANVAMGVGSSITLDRSIAGWVLSTGTADNEMAMMYTHRRHYVQPGASQLAMFAVACGDSGKENNLRSWGIGDRDEHISFQLLGTTLGIVHSTTIANHGTVFIPQSQWNADKLDGTGVSGYLIDPTHLEYYWIDMQHPFGLVRFGIYDDDGNRVVCHNFRSTLVASGLPYLKTPHLPITFQSLNTGVTTGGSSLKVFQASVYSEGDPDYTFWRVGGIGVVGKSVTTNTPLVEIKSKKWIDAEGTIYNPVNVYPEYLNIYAEGSPVKIDLIYAPIASLTGDIWSAVGDHTILSSNTSTAIDLTNADIHATFYCGIGATKIGIADLFELNDEGILFKQNPDNFMDEDSTEGLMIVATRLDSEAITSVTCDLSARELW